MIYSLKEQNPMIVKETDLSWYKNNTKVAVISPLFPKRLSLSLAQARQSTVARGKKL